MLSRIIMLKISVSGQGQGGVSAGANTVVRCRVRRARLAAADLLRTIASHSPSNLVSRVLAGRATMDPEDEPQEEHPDGEVGRPELGSALQALRPPVL